jgi:myo-inositol-1(or 4)-monophosphatase
MLNLSIYFDAAKKSVFESGEILKKYFYGNFKVDYKGERNPVTTADKKSENAILKTLSRKFPDIEFLCEESCNIRKTKDDKLVWVIDPLDGTVNFLHKFPIFSISLALCKGRDVLLGIVYNPISKEFFHAVKNRGAYLNGKKINVSKIGDLKYSLIVTGFPYGYKRRQERIIRNFKNFFVRSEGIRRLGSAAIDLCYVACGCFEGFWEEGLQPWDDAAGSLIVEESGGRVTDFKGGKKYLFEENIIASNSKVHNKMLEVIGGRK